jgi:hypothetical protein
MTRAAIVTGGRRAIAVGADAADATAAADAVARVVVDG